MAGPSAAPPSLCTAGHRLLELLFQEPGLVEYPLPERLSQHYGGGLGFQEPLWYANFVSSLDGVVSVPGRAHVGSLLSAHSQADRFSMALLRACADAVVVGAGTLRDSPGTLWTAERAYPSLASEFQELRRRLARSPQPQLVVVTRSGELDPTHPALQEGVLVVAPDAKVGQLKDRLGPSTSWLGYPGPQVDWAWLARQLLARGLRAVLTEAGPTTMGRLLELGLVDELFLTLAPTVAGTPVGYQRSGFAGGVDLLGKGDARAHLLATRRAGDHLLLRYRLGTAAK